MPQSQKQRSIWLGELADSAGELHHIGVGYLDAMSMTLTQVRDVFESKPWESIKKNKEAEQKLWAAAFGRLDNLSKGQMQLGKLLQAIASRPAL